MLECHNYLCIYSIYFLTFITRAYLQIFALLGMSFSIGINTWSQVWEYRRLSNCLPLQVGVDKYSRNYVNNGCGNCFQFLSIMHLTFYTSDRIDVSSFDGVAPLYLQRCMSHCYGFRQSGDKQAPSCAMNVHAFSNLVGEGSRIRLLNIGIGSSVLWCICYGQCG